MSSERVLVVGSLPLAAPWNGADKVIARTIVRADTGTRYIVETGRREPWPEHVEAVRQRSVDTMPGLAARFRATRFLVSQTPRAGLIHVVASIRHPVRASAAAVRAWGGLARRPIVHSVPSLTPETFDPRSLVGDVTVVFSRFSKEMLERLGVRDVQHVFPPVEIPEPPSPARIAVARDELGIGPAAMLYAAHLDASSGMETAIAALGRVPAALGAELVIAARWRPGQDVEAALAALRAAAVDHGVNDRLRIVTDVRDMPALIGACALTVLVPESLAGKMDMPLVLLESLAIGRPIILSSRPPIVEALLGGGHAVEPGNVAELAAAMEALLESEPLRARLAATGRRNLLNVSAPAHCARTYREIYARVRRELAPAARISP